MSSSELDVHLRCGAGSSSSVALSCTADDESTLGVKDNLNEPGTPLPPQSAPSDTPSRLAASCLRLVHLATVIKRRCAAYLPRVLYIVLLLCYAAYFAFAMVIDRRSADAKCLIGLTVIGSTLLTCRQFSLTERLQRQLGAVTRKGVFDGARERIQRNRRRIRHISYCIILLAICAYLVGVVFIHRPRNMVSLFGLLVLILVMWVFSTSPFQVKVAPVFGGFVLQFCCALLVLRWKPGYQILHWVAERITEFLDHRYAGSNFVFGSLSGGPPEVAVFAFKLLPVITFFSSTICVLYHWGVMQWFVAKVGYIMEFCLETTAGESMNAAANMFMSMSESPLTVKPLLPQMTRSEIHAVMAGGFASISGGIMAVYISMKVPASHLLSASVMSAPAALACAKLLLPETEKSATTSEQVAKVSSDEARSAFDALSQGALTSVRMIAAICVMLIAILATLDFLNATLVWLGARVGLDGVNHVSLSFELICSYVFWPLAWLLGTPVQDCRIMAQLIGVKTFLNEFIAYQQLLVALGWIMQDSSIAIATYALCGFSNFGSIGVLTASLSALAPTKKSVVVDCALRAMVAGTMACLMTACIAGMLFTDGDQF